nr:RNA-directed DNA polymerase, eukaryota, reverse transcriptase zinc-binding domain protein [Tanacetum cinerariifolium]
DRQILDGPFILNEALAWCKRKKTQALIFKVDFAKAYYSVRWDFLLDVLQAYGFGSRWCSWIRGIFSSNMASILVNGSPTAEFSILCGLKQGDPLAPLLFILVMESLHISVSRAVNDGVFKGEWSDDNLANLIRMLQCFQLASGLKINVHKSQVLGVGVHPDIKVRTRLSKWKVKTLSIGGRLTLLKSVLGAVPLYSMSIYKAPKGVLHELEMIRNSFFNGADFAEKKITWVAWDKVLASKKQGGLGVSSYYALNRALLLKWVWRFISQDGSLWSRIISAFYGSSIEDHDPKRSSYWSSILREVQTLALQDWDGAESQQWAELLSLLERNTEISVAAKWGDPSFDYSFRRQDWDGASQQWAELLSLLGTFTLSPSIDRWVSDLNGEGSFRVKDFRSFLDDLFLPSSNMTTRWVKCVPTKVNVFVWRARLERLPTRDNLAKRGVPIDSNLWSWAKGDVPLSGKKWRKGASMVDQNRVRLCSLVHNPDHLISASSGVTLNSLSVLWSVIHMGYLYKSFLVKLV